MQLILSKKLYILFGLVLSLFIASVSIIFPDIFPITPTPVPSPEASPSATPNPQHGGVFATVVSVVDGDTIKVEGGEIVRYIGVDTPETVDRRKPVECFGKEASAKNKELVQGKMVELEKDVSERDRYGRLLRYIWIGDTLINETLVREGFARVSTYPPDVKYVDRFLTAERAAREEKKGLWSGACPLPTPNTASPSASVIPTLRPHSR